VKKSKKGGVAFPDPAETLAGRIGDAKWIWAGENPRPINAFRLFRREFEIEKIPDRTELFIFAEFRYKLYINGKFIQVGPTPSRPERRLIDRFEVSKHLVAGRNCIGVIVHCPGVITGQWTLVNPALFCYITCGDGKLEIGTDESWRTVRAEAWTNPTQFCSYGKGFEEWHVASRMPAGWNEAGFDEAGWEAAKVLHFYPYGAPEDLRENYVGYPNLVMHYPVAFVGAGIADGKISDKMRQDAGEYYTASRNRRVIQMGDWHLRDLSRPLPGNEPLPEPIAKRAQYETHRSAPPEMAEFPEKGDCSGPLSGAIKVPEEGHPFVIFDLAVVRSGLFVVDVESGSGGTIDIAWSHRLDEGRVNPFGSGVPNCHRVEVPPGRISWEGFFDRGARFAQLIFRGFKGEVKLHQFGMRETLVLPRDVPEATFESGDDLLDRIWRASVETTRHYVNGCGCGDAVRERHHWFHDDSMALRMAFYIWGEWSNWRRGLELTAQSQNTDGSFPVISPGGCEDYNMVSGSCYWVSSVAEYFRTTGDRAFAEEMLPRFEAHITYELRFADAGGLLYETPGRRFLSWADGNPRTPYKKGETWKKTGRKGWGDFFDPPTLGYNAIINTYWLWSLRDAAGTARLLGRTEEAKRWGEIFSSARKAFEQVFWMEDVGLYRDNLFFFADGTTSTPTFCESTIFLMMRAGLLENERGLRCVDKLFEPDFVCCRTSGGLDLGSLSPFLIEAGRVDDALELYRDRWGAPVLAGETTCGEEFFPQSSNCHIHGATPARDFIEYLAGIRIAGPLWNEVILAPPAGGPDLSASVPAQDGEIKVEIKTKGAGRIVTYSAPAGCKLFALKKGKKVALASGSGSFEIA